jgi:hypothetical protein
MTGHTASVYSLAFSAESTLLVSGGADWTVRCWDVKGAGGLRKPSAATAGKDELGIETFVFKWMRVCPRELTTPQGGPGAHAADEADTDRERAVHVPESMHGRRLVRAARTTYLSSVLYPCSLWLPLSGGDAKRRCWFTCPRPLLLLLHTLAPSRAALAPVLASPPRAPHRPVNTLLRLLQQPRAPTMADGMDIDADVQMDAGSPAPAPALSGPAIHGADAYTPQPLSAAPSTDAGSGARPTPPPPAFREIPVKVHIRRPDRDNWTYLGRAVVAYEPHGPRGAASRVGERAPRTVWAPGAC